MARWSHRTLIPPDIWAQIVGFEPCAWNGVFYPDDRRGCDEWYQQPWQSEPIRAGRETVGLAVLNAERKMASRLGFQIAPRYFTDEEDAWPKNGREVSLDWGYLQTVGVEARDPIQLGAAVVYTDVESYGDGYKETATITVTVPAGTEPCEIAVYYPGEVTADDIKDSDETWRIQPLEVNVSGTTATITGHRCQFVRWAKHRDGELVDITDDTAFLDAVDVFRRYTDPRGAFAVWYDDVNCLSGCDDLTQALCGVVQNERLSHARLSPATYNATTGVWTRAAWTYCTCPDKSRVSYLAGWRDPAVRDSCYAFGELGEVVAKLSLTFIREDVCQCAQFSWLWDGARKELGIVKGQANSMIAASYEYFGSTMVGALEAYVWAREHSISRGGSLT